MKVLILILMGITIFIIADYALNRKSKGGTIIGFKRERDEIKKPDQGTE